MTFDAELANLAAEVAEHLGSDDLVTVTPFTVTSATNLSTGKRVRAAGTAATVKSSVSMIRSVPMGEGRREIAVEAFFDLVIDDLGFTPDRFTEITWKGVVYDVVSVDIQLHGKMAQCRAKIKGRPSA
jgi:hypothetical protein